LLQRTAAALAVFRLWRNLTVDGLGERRFQRRSLSVTLVYDMKLPLHFLIPLVISTSSVGWNACAQQPGRVPPGTNSWQADQEASDALTKKLSVVPAFRDYLAKCSTAIVQKPVKWKGSPVGTYIVTRYKLHENGAVSGIELSGNTNTPAALSIVKNITSCSPFPAWPNGMRSAAGKPYLEMYLHCGFARPPENGGAWKAANNFVQATPVYPVLFFPGQVPGAPDDNR